MGKNDYDDVFNVCLCVSVSVCVSVVSLHFVSLMLLRVEWHAGTRNTVWPFVNVRVCTILRTLCRESFESRQWLKGKQARERESGKLDQPSQHAFTAQ